MKIKLDIECPKCKSIQLSADTDGIIIYHLGQDGMFSLTRAHPHEQIFNLKCAKCEHTWVKEGK